jgi:hypothetical protein
MNQKYQGLYRMLQRGMRGNNSNTVLCYRDIVLAELQKAGYKVSRASGWVRLSEALRKFAPGCDKPDPGRTQPAICDEDRRILDCMSGKAKDTCIAEMIHLHGVTFRRLRDLGYGEIHARSSGPTLAKTLQTYLLGSVVGSTQDDEVLTFRASILTNLAKEVLNERKVRKDHALDPWFQKWSSDELKRAKKEAKRMLARIGVTEAETATPRRLRNLFYHHFPSFMWSPDCPPDTLDDDIIWPWTHRKGKDSWKI